MATEEMIPYFRLYIFIAMLYTVGYKKWFKEDKTSYLCNMFELTTYFFILQVKQFDYFIVRNWKILF
jgi:hypothetical protein